MSPKAKIRDSSQRRLSPVGAVQVLRKVLDQSRRRDRRLTQVVLSSPDGTRRTHTGEEALRTLIKYAVELEHRLSVFGKSTPRGRRRKTGDHWLNPVETTRRIDEILANRSRYRDAQQDFAPLEQGLLRLAEQLVAPQSLTDRQRRTVKRLAKTGKRSVIIKTFEGWQNAELSDRVLRKISDDLRKTAAEVRWR